MSEFSDSLDNFNIKNFKLSKLVSSLEKLTRREIETLDITFNVDQFQMLLDSMKEAKEGKVVSFADAFDDLD